MSGSFTKIVIESDSAEAVAAITSSKLLLNPFLEMVGAICYAIPPNVGFNSARFSGKSTLWQIV